MALIRKFALLVLIVSILLPSIPAFALNQYTVSIKFYGNGNVYPNGQVSVDEGLAQEISAVADIGYYISKFVVNGREIVEAFGKNTYTYIIPSVTSNYDINVYFEKYTDKNWNLVGPFGKTIYYKTAEINGVYYIGTNEGIYKVNTQEQSISKLGVELGYNNVWSILVDSSNNNTIYAGTDTGLYKSTDGGISWSLVGFGGANVWSVVNIGFPNNLMVVADVGTTTITQGGNPFIMRGEAKIMRSSNGGVNWESVNTPAGKTPYALYFDKSTNTIYLAASNGLYKSSNQNINWSLVKSFNSDILNVSVLNGYIVVVDGTKYYASKDGGSTWSQYDMLPYANSIYFAVAEKNKINVCAMNDGIFYVDLNSPNNVVQDTTFLYNDLNNAVLMDNGNIVVTSNYQIISKGNTWKTVGKLSDAITAMSKYSSDYILIGDEAGNIFIFNIKNNLQDTIASIYQKIKEFKVYKDFIFVISESGFLYKLKKDNSGTWQISSYDNIDLVNDVEYDETSGIIYAGTNYGLYTSKDGGNSWQMSAINDKNIAIVRISNGKVYAHSYDFGLYVYDVKSNTAKKVNTPKNYISSLYINDQTIVIGDEEGIFISLDGGNFWSNIGLKYHYPVIMSVSKSQDTYSIYALTPAGVYNRVYKPKVFTINVTYNEGGSVSPATATALEGSSLKFTITPNKNYKVKEVKVDGVSKGAVTSWTFDNITANHTLEVIFEKNQIIVVLKIGSKTFTVNDEIRTLDSPPIIKNSRTLLPIRAVVESLGGRVEWYDAEKKVVVYLKDKKVTMWIGRNYAYVNGVKTQIDATNLKVMPEIINGRTMLPVRFVAESLGCEVEWVPSTQSVVIKFTP